MARSPQASSSAISAPVIALRSPPPPLALGQRVRDQAELVGPREHVVRQLARFAALARAGPHLARRELAHGLDDEPLLVAGLEVDHGGYGAGIARASAFARLRLAARFACIERVPPRCAATGKTR